MLRPRVHPVDPLRWCIALTLLFAALVSANLAIPHKLYFDEIHYIPAARHLLALDVFTNREHPPFGKELLAIGPAVVGDNSWGWRLMPMLAGSLALFAAMRALWFAAQSRFATIAYGVLLVTGFYLFVHARIAMLDIFMVCFLAVGWWQIAAAMREPETGRGRLALAGIALGLAMASKWNAVPLVVLPGVGFLVLRFSAGRRRLLTSRRGRPVPGITLIEAGLWLGIVPLLTYALTFAPGWFFAKDAIQGPPWVLYAHHEFMLRLQESVIKPHPYMSRWTEWVGNWRAIWYLYENVDGAQRGVLLIGNPLTMMLGLPALLYCLWQGAVRRQPAHFAVVLLYAASLGMWIVAAKPVQFLYHYFTPGMALLAALALMLDALWQRGWRKTALVPLVAACGLFAYFFPILAALPLDHAKSYQDYTWLRSWR